MSPLHALTADVHRLLAAGACAAANDEKLCRHAAGVRELVGRVPALNGLADLLDRVAGEASPAAFLDLLLLLLRPVRTALAGAGVPGELEAFPPSGPWSSKLPTDHVTLVAAGLAGSANHKIFATLALENGSVGDLRLLSPLLAGLEGEHHRAITEQGLPAFGPEVVPDLRRGLNLQGNQADRCRLVAVCRADPDAGAELCCEVLLGGNVFLRRQALASLPDLVAAEVAAAALLRLLPGEEDAGLRVEFLRTLGRIARAAPAAVLAFAGELVHPHADVRTAAARALTAAVPEAVTAAAPAEGGNAVVLCRALRDPFDEVRAAAALVLRRWGEKGGEAVAALLEALTDGAGRVRHEALAAVAQLGPGFRPELAAALAQALRHKDEAVRGEAAEALAILGLGGPQTVAALAAALRDRSASVRAQAARSLGHLGTAEAVDALTGSLRDEKVEVARAAAWALARLGPAARAAVPALRQMRETRQSRHLRHAAAHALSQIEGETT
jgi:HEAT repeat protein